MANPSPSPLPDWQVPPALVKHTKPVYGFYVSYGYRYMFQHYTQLYAASHLISLLIPDGNYTRKNDFTITTPAGLTIRLENPNGRKGPSYFDAILNYTLTPSEREFTFPDAIESQYRGFTSSKASREAQNDQTPDNDQSQPPNVTQRAPKATQTLPPARTPRPSNLVTVADIAATLKIDAKQARQALRKAKIDKPEHGWAFPAADVPAITAAIKEHLK